MYSENPEIRFVYRNLNLDCTHNRSQVKYTCELAAMMEDPVALSIRSAENEWTINRKTTVWLTSEGVNTFTLSSSEGAPSYTLEATLTRCPADQVALLQTCHSHLYFDK